MQTEMSKGPLAEDEHSRKGMMGGGWPKAGRPPIIPCLPWSSTAFPLAFLFACVRRFVGAYFVLLLFILEVVVASMHPCIHASMHPCIHASMHPCIHATMHPCIHACMHPCIHASMHPCIHASMHTCIRASMHPCIHAYMHTCIRLPT